MIQSTMETATKTTNYIVKTLDPYMPAAAKDAAGYVAKSAESVAKSAYETGTASATFAQQKVTEAVEFGKSTITALTPDPVMSLLNKSMETAEAVRQDPVGTVKAYVPDFVIQAGEKTYEVVGHTADSTIKTVGEASGFIVTKVNGSVDYITHIPQVENLITELKKLIPAKEGVTSEE